MTMNAYGPGNGHGHHLVPFSRAGSGVGGLVATRWPHRYLTEIDLRITERARDTMSLYAAVLLEVQTPVGTYQDAWEYAHPGDPGYTFELANPLVREGEVATAVTRKIDYILVRSVLHGPTLQVAHCQRVLDRPVDGVWASDHSGVLADVVLPANPPGFRS